MANKMPWMKQIYLSLVPAVPIGYLLLHGFRGQEFFTKFYVNRSVIPASESLKQFVESELDRLENIRHSKLIITLTNEFEPKVYGGFFLNRGVELQFPLRAAIDDVEMARRLGSNMEMDLGLAKYRRKVEANSTIGDELMSRMMLSDNAKRFIIQRQLQLANNGVFFCAPIFTWMGICSAGYFIFAGMIPIVGNAIAFGATVALVVLCYNQLMSFIRADLMKKADIAACQMGKEYLCGAKDYFTSSMNFMRLLRRILGDEGEKNIKKNGDSKLDPVAYSERLKNIENLAIKKNETLDCPK